MSGLMRYSFKPQENPFKNKKNINNTNKIIKDIEILVNSDDHDYYEKKIKEQKNKKPNSNDEYEYENFFSYFCGIVFSTLIAIIVISMILIYLRIIRGNNAEKNNIN